MLTDIVSPLLRRPLLCLAVLWAAGILLAAHCAIPWGAWLAATGILLLGWLLLANIPNPLAVLPLALAVFTLAAGACAWRNAPLPPGDLRYLTPGGITVTGYPLTTPLRGEEDVWHVSFRLLSRREGTHWYRAAGTVYLTGVGESPQPGRNYAVLAKVLPTDEPGNPYGFSWRSYLVQHGYTYRVRAYTLDLLPGQAPLPPLHAARAFCSRRLRASMPQAYGSLHATLLEGLVLGVYGAPLPAEVSEQFRRAGTIHLMVVSGSQVTLLCGLFVLPLMLLPSGHVRASYPRMRRWLLLLALPILALYVTLADRGPSVDRALLVALLATVSLLIDLSPLARRRSFRFDGVTLLSAAALVLLIGQPMLLFDAGMQLSFVASFGLLTLTPVFMRLLRRLPMMINLPLSATLGAQLVTIPVLAWHFGLVPLLAPFTNLISVPVVGLLLPLGLLTLLCAVTVPPVAVLLNYLNLPLLKLLLVTSATAAALPHAQLVWYTRSPLAVLLYYAVIGLCAKALSLWLDSHVEGWDIPAGREPRMW